MRFALPHMLWLLLLVPIIAAYLIWTIGKRRDLLRRFATSKALSRLQLVATGTMTWVRTGLFLLGVTALIVALARPQWGFHERRIVSRGVDMMIAIDTSESMMARDFQPDRISRAKDLLKNLIWEAQGARVGVIAFSGAAAIMCPLTLDYNMASTALKAVDINTVSARGTNIAAAIDAALGSFEISGGNDRILILLTDGEQTEQLETLDKAVNKAAENGMRIFGIGIGTSKGATIPTLRGAKVDSAGNVITTKIDFSKLEEISQKTKGVAIRAEKMGAGEIAEISAQLAKFKGQKQLDKSVRIYHERYSWFLAFALVCFILEALLRHFRGFGWMRFGRAATVIIAGAAIGLSAENAAAYPGEAFVRSREAYQKFQSGDYDSAVELYTEAVAISPQDPQLLYNLGAAAAKAKQTSQSETAFRSVYDPTNPRLNADALFGAAMLNHTDVRKTIKEQMPAWKEAMAQPSEAGDAAKVEVEAEKGKLETVIKEYKNAILAKPDDADMKANYEIAKRDLEELEDLLKEYDKKKEEQQKQQEQKPQDQKNEDKDKPDQKDQNKDQQGQDDQDQQGQQGKDDQKNPDKPKDENPPKETPKSGDQKPDEGKDPEGKDQSDQQNPNGQKPTPTPGPEPGDKDQPGKQQSPKGTPTPTPSPSPNGKPQPGANPGEQPGAGAEGTPVPVGEMSPSDVDRLLNTLPAEDQNALQLMFGNSSTQEDMKNDW